VKNDVNILLKGVIIFFCWRLEDYRRKEQDPDPLQKYESADPDP
jgi:hypothetical protein